MLLNKTNHVQEGAVVGIEPKESLDEASLDSRNEGRSLKSRSSTEELEPPTSPAQNNLDASTPECRSPSPEAPLTPPPTLSPILFSLEDLKDMRKGPGSQSNSSLEGSSIRRMKAKLPSLPGSLPSSPKNGLTSSWSRDDLQIQAFRDDHRIKQTTKRPPHSQPSRATETPTYKAIAAKSVARPIASTRVASVVRTHVQELSRESCARSETALDEEAENVSLTRDETTTITTSGVSQRAEELTALREERNQFRDMCLCLGGQYVLLVSRNPQQLSSSQFHFC